MQFFFNSHKKKKRRKRKIFTRCTVPNVKYRIQKLTQMYVEVFFLYVVEIYVEFRSYRRTARVYFFLDKKNKITILQTNTNTGSVIHGYNFTFSINLRTCKET